MPTALYKSRAWLFREYITLKKSPEEIAKFCGVSHMTIYRYINEYKLKR
jgi:DNA invertase Pin-like site-specific DNA recombinase